MPHKRGRSRQLSATAATRVCVCVGGGVPIGTHPWVLIWPWQGCSWQPFLIINNSCSRSNGWKLESARPMGSHGIWQENDFLIKIWKMWYSGKPVSRSWLPWCCWEFSTPSVNSAQSFPYFKWEGTFLLIMWQPRDVFQIAQHFQQFQIVQRRGQNISYLVTAFFMSIDMLYLVDVANSHGHIGGKTGMISQIGWNFAMHAVISRLISTGSWSKDARMRWQCSTEELLSHQFLLVLAQCQIPPDKNALYRHSIFTSKVRFTLLRLYLPDQPINEIGINYWGMFSCVYWFWSS